MSNLKAFSYIAKPAVIRPTPKALVAEVQRSLAAGKVADGAALNLETPNQRHGEHWRPAAKRAKAQRAAMKRVTQAWLEVHGPRLVITLTRVSPRKVDGPNLGAALKHVIDGMADALRVDDGSPVIEWQLEQRKGTPARVEWSMSWSNGHHVTPVFPLEAAAIEARS